MAVQCLTAYLRRFVRDHEFEAILPRVRAAHETLHAKTGPGNEFLGWLDLPAQGNKEELERIKDAAARIRAQSDVLIVIGIGGSYLGARAVIEGLLSAYHNQLPENGLQVYFAGNTLHPSSMNQLLRICKGKDVSVIVVSKSGTTTEPALAFRFFRDMLERRYGKDGAQGRIFCITDRSRGTLKRLANLENYECFVIPDDIGGRYSVLTPVGLLPIAAAGCDIDALLRGAADAREAFAGCDLETNACYRYAAARHLLAAKGKGIEVLVSYDPNLAMFSEWYKQLFGESEGKDGKGIFPASMIFSTDLHSLGQYVQDGSRTLFETVLHVEKPASDRMIPMVGGDFDGMNFVAGKSLADVNRKAFQGTLLAHLEGGAPNIVLTVPQLDAYEFGWLIYFFEKACAISGYMLGVNPFDQPGVESYKKNMFALLGKPGYEGLQEELEAKL